MALDMSSATYARSQSGEKVLYNDFAGDIDNIIKILNGDKYTTFKKTINAYWVGPDATDFLNDIEKTRQELQQKLNALKSQFQGALSADMKQFQQFQAQNVK